MSRRVPFRPIANRVLVRRDDQDEKSRGGILLPDKRNKSFDNAFKGTVIAVGPGKLWDNGTRREPEVKPGDRVLFARWSQQEAPPEWGKNHIIILEDDVLGVILEE